MPERGVSPKQELFARLEAQALELNVLHLLRCLHIRSRARLHVVTLADQRVKRLVGIVGADLDGLIIRPEQNDVLGGPTTGNILQREASFLRND